MKQPQSRAITAFSLVELSVVIVVISILVVGALSILTSGAGNKKSKITQKRAQEIYQAMGIFLAKNGYLPCPAAINLNKSDTNYGVQKDCSVTASSPQGYWRSSNASSPNLYYGMVPTKTLGLASSFSEDGFESKFGYFVLQGLTASETFGKGSASVATSKNYANDSDLLRLIIKEKPSAASTITSDAAFVIISYGANKNGSWNSNSQQRGAASNNDEEIENSVDNMDSPAMGRADFDNVIFASSASSSGFDDIIFYKTRDEIAQNFKLSSLLPCDKAIDENLTYGGASASYHWNGSEDAKYGEIIPSTTNCPSTYMGGPTQPAKKCGLFGNWESGAAKNCIINPT